MQPGTFNDMRFGWIIDIGAPGPERGQPGLNKQPETDQP